MKCTRKKWWCAASFLSALILSLAGCQTPEPRYDEVEGLPATSGSQPLAIQAGDEILFTFPSSELAAPCSVTVKEDGSVTIPGLGSLNVVGKTPEQVQREIQEKFGKQLGLQPHYAARYFHVTGEVKRPGPALYLGQTDLVRAISAAGDLTSFASKDNVQIIRANGQEQTVNYQRILDDPRHTILIFPGDRIKVPHR